MTTANYAEGDVRESLRNELNTYADFIHTVLSIIRTTLTRDLSHNTHLVYTLLHVKDDLFAMHPFSEALAPEKAMQVDARFGPVSRHIWHIVNAFEQELRKSPVQAEQQTLEQIMEFINRKARTWRDEFLEEADEDMEPLQFRYEEEQNCGEFFMPYVWCIVYHYSGLVWNYKTIKLFTIKASTSTPTPSIFEDVAVADVILEAEEPPDTQIKVVV